ncbi:MAG: phasin family protein [Xanthobacteraceae bacterium]|nr:phasin family protein [Xanthobacteraceae bacterium]
MASEPMMSSISQKLDAMMRSSQIWAAGFQDISKTFSTMANAQLEANMAMMKALSSVKTPQEAFDIQTHHVQKSVEKAVSDTNQISEATNKLTHDCMVPLSTHVVPVMETAKHKAA